MNGGPSHVDTFDPKPDLDQYATASRCRPELRTERKTGAAAEVAVQVPQVRPERASRSASCSPRRRPHIDDICVIRSMHTDIPNHEPGAALMNCGNGAADPAEHGLVAHLRPRHREPEPARLRRPLPRQAGGRPAAVEQQLPAGRLPGHAHQHTSRPRAEKSSSTSATATTRPDRAARDSSTCSQRAEPRCTWSAGRATTAARARIQSFEMAFRMQTEAPRTPSTSPRAARTRREAYGPGDPFADACLLARRLVERGVRFVQVYYGNGQPWDDHDDIEKGTAPSSPRTATGRSPRCSAT